MKIKTVTVTNFRSIRSVILEAASFNVFVGQNNHGKTNFLQAIEWFYSGKGEVAEIRHIDAGPKDEVMVEVEFVGVKDGIGRISNPNDAPKARTGTDVDLGRPPRPWASACRHLSRIGAKKEGNPFGSPHRNCEKL